MQHHTFHISHSTRSNNLKTMPIPTLPQTTGTTDGYHSPHHYSSRKQSHLKRIDRSKSISWRAREISPVTIYSTSTLHHSKQQQQQ